MLNVLRRGILGGAILISPHLAVGAGLGATINRDNGVISGVTFRAWAPYATGISVRGDFTNWDDVAMAKNGETDLWEVVVPDAKPGDEYKYLVRWENNPEGVNQLDPRSVWIRADKDGNLNSVIYDHEAFDWGGHKTAPTIPPEERIMYEMHIGTFYDPDPNDGKPGTFDDAIGRLPYLSRLGVNVVALMPIAEFFTGTSWGYNPQYPFAIEDSYGGPDGLKRFVREAHRLGISVQVDIVHNHWGSEREEVELMTFGGGNSYFYDPDGPLGRTKWGPRPKYDEPRVREFIIDNVRTLLDDYGIDGLRWDSPRNIVGFDANSTGMGDVGDPQTIIPEGKSLLAEINSIIHGEMSYAGRWSVSEDSDLLVPIGAQTYVDPFLAGAQVGSESQSFDGHWQVSFHNAITPQIGAEEALVNVIRTKVSEWSEPPGWRVIFTDNHDKAGDLNIGSEVEENPLVGWRLANRMDPDNQQPSSVYDIPVTNSIANPVVQKRVLLNAILTLTSPGVPMLFMGQEFGATGSFSDSNRLRWREGGWQTPIWRAHRDMIRLRSSLEALKVLELGAGGNSLVSGPVLAYWRGNAAGEGGEVFVALNFSPSSEVLPLTHLPSGGEWYAQLNTDWTIYGGSTLPTITPLTTNSTLTLPAYSSVILAKSPPEEGRLGDANTEIPDAWLSFFGLEVIDGDEDGDGLSNLIEYQMGLDPLEQDIATVTYRGKSHAMRASPNNPVAQHIAWVNGGGISGAVFTFLSKSVTGPLVGAVDGAYVRFTFNLTDSTFSHSSFSPEGDLSTPDSNRTNWALFHGVASFEDNPDGDAFDNFQEFMRGSDPNLANQEMVALAGSFNGWNANGNPMTFAGGGLWVLDIPMRGGTVEEFKFTTGDWSQFSWGEGIGETADPAGGDILVDLGQGKGIYQFRFDETTLNYGVTYNSADLNGDGIQDAWISYYGLEGGAAVAGADPDGDGWSNLAEFARFINYDGTLMNPAISDQAVSPKRMTLTGSAEPMPSWNPVVNNMEWSDHRMRWEWVGAFGNTGVIQFKFSQASGADWSGGASWGWGEAGVEEGFALRSGPANIIATLSEDGRYRFAFDDLTGVYTISSFPMSAEWWETNGLPGDFPVDGSDPRWRSDLDRDGYNLQLEYALGGGPWGSDRLVNTAQTNYGGTNHLVMTWLQRTNDTSGLAVIPLVSTNLAGSWGTLEGTVSSNTSGVPDGFRRMEVSVPMDGGAKFLRLRVEGP